MCHLTQSRFGLLFVIMDDAADRSENIDLPVNVKVVKKRITIKKKHLKCFLSFK